MTFCHPRSVALAALLAALAACNMNSPDPERAVAGGALAAGWSVRPDSGSAEQISMVAQGDGFQFTMGPAGTFYNPEWTKSGDYQYSARLTQVKEPSHAISYGLVIGGSDMAGDNQTYTYFLVRNEGDYFIANHEADERRVIVDWAENAAVVPQGEGGRQTNTLGVQTEGDYVVFRINGTEVTRLPKGQVHADGLIGFRIGHALDVDVDQISR